MLTRYIEAAMRRAEVRQLADDATYVGEIPDLQGVWASAASVEACLAELREVLEEWILLRLSQQLSIPVIDHINLTVHEVA